MTRHLPKIIAINSMPAYGNAGLKCVLSILKTHTIPIPSLLLSGLGNVPDYQKFTYDFSNNLEATFRHIQRFEEQVIVYIGYLADAVQIDVILDVVNKYNSLIQAIVVDPVSGDNGKPYVSDALIRSWQKLLTKANWATPNITELQILSGHHSIDRAIAELQQQFPATNWIVTSYPIEPGRISNRWINQTSIEDYIHAEKPMKLSGTGDAFTSFFIQRHFIQQEVPLVAIQNATQDTLAFIDQYILPFYNNTPTKVDK